MKYPRHRAVIAVLFGSGLALGACTNTADRAPMPQTRGMHDMDPALHEEWATQDEHDLYKDCVTNEAAAAHQNQHPMADTRGMKGMDSKAHVMDCPEGYIAKADPSVHVHKGPGG